MADQHPADSNSTDRSIKVTDKRLFTADGELRDEYRHLGDRSDAETTPADSEDPPAAAPAGSRDQATPQTAAPDDSESPEADEDEETPSGAMFEDLVGLLAQSASVYLQQASHPEARQEHLEMARMHVDLLAILKRKTRGNLSPRETALLDDALYQLRMAFVRHG